MATVNDDRGLSVFTDSAQQFSNDRQWSLRGRQANALEATTLLGHQRSESFNRDRQMGATLVSSQGVDLINDDGRHVL